MRLKGYFFILTFFLIILGGVILYFGGWIYRPLLYGSEILIAFLLIYFSGRNEFYYLTFRDLWWFWERAQNGGRKSFLYEELNPSYFLTNHGGILVPYLDGIQKELQDRD